MVQPQREHEGRERLLIEHAVRIGLGLREVPVAGPDHGERALAHADRHAVRPADDGARFVDLAAAVRVEGGAQARVGVERDAGRERGRCPRRRRAGRCGIGGAVAHRREGRIRSPLLRSPGHSATQQSAVGQTLLVAAVAPYERRRHPGARLRWIVRRLAPQFHEPDRALSRNRRAAPARRTSV